MEILRNHPHWNQTFAVCETLRKAGFSVVLAGGCVRDALLGVVAKDLDVATDAHPDQVQALFPKSLEIGKAFGIIILPFKDFQIEVATFRKDGPYSDGRHPQHIQFATDHDDALRRDFTINALFYDPFSDRVIDYVNGQDDVRSRIIRTVGVPALRFSEDKLRILRALRFVSQLDFEIEKETFSTLSKMSHELSIVSHERIRDEISKLLMGTSRVRAFELLLASGCWSGLIADIITKDQYIKWAQHSRERTRRFLAHIQKSTHLEVRWSALLFEMPTNLKALTQYFKLSNEVSHRISISIQLARDWSKWTRARDGEAILHSHSKDFSYALEFLELLERVQPDSARSSLIQRFHELLRRVPTLPVPCVTGADLKALGITPGPLMGRLLERAFILQLESPTASKEELIRASQSQIET